MTPALIGAGVAAIWMAIPRTACADPSPEGRAIAERLYEQGRSQMAAKEYAKACESFAESLRFDGGTGTLLNLAACHRALDKLASAWAEFREAASAARTEGRPDRVRYAQRQLAEIEPRLGHVIISLGAVDSAADEDLVITLDGKALGFAAWNVAIPVDAGTHEVIARKAGRPTFRSSIVVVDGDKQTVAVPRPPAELAVPGPPAKVTLAQPSLAQPPAVPPDREVPGRARPTAAWLLGGAGVAAVAVGSFFGWRAFSLWHDRNRLCPGENCTAEGARNGRQAGEAANVANWTTGAGILAVGAAAVLLLWPRSDTRPVSSAARLLRATAVDASGAVIVRSSF